MRKQNRIPVYVASVVYALVVVRCAGGVDVGHFGATDSGFPFDVMRPDGGDGLDVVVSVDTDGGDAREDREGTPPDASDADANDEDADETSIAPDAAGD